MEGDTMAKAFGILVGKDMSMSEHTVKIVPRPKTRVKWDLVFNGQ